MAYYIIYLVHYYPGTGRDAHWPLCNRVRETETPSQGEMLQRGFGLAYCVYVKNRIWSVSVLYWEALVLWHELIIKFN